MPSFLEKLAQPVRILKKQFFFLGDDPRFDGLSNKNSNSASTATTSSSANDAAQADAEKPTLNGEQDSSTDNLVDASDTNDADAKANGNGVVETAQPEENAWSGRRQEQTRLENLNM